MRFRLFVLIAAVVIPAAVAFSLLILDLYRHERAARERQLFSTAGASAAAVEADLGRGWALLEVLAKSDTLAGENWKGLEVEARRIAPPDMAFTLEDRSGRVLLDTRPSPGPRIGAGAWIRLLNEGRLVSNIVVDRTSAEPTVAMRLLIRDRGTPAYALSLVMSPSVQARLLESQRLPKGWVAGLLDRNGASIARSPYLPHRVGRLGTPDMVARVRRGEQGVSHTVSLTGQRMVAAYKRIPSSGWTVVVAAPRAEFEEGAARSLLLALALSLFFLLGGVLLALGLSRRLITAADQLESQAEAVGLGEAGPPRATGVLEADRVSRALALAAAERLAHERELATLNANLETRVAEATEQLVQAQKMEALGQLTGGLAHDFNNLLTAVLGNIGLLLRTPLNERQSRLAANAQAAGERGARLTAQLLAFGRRQRLAPEPVDLTALIDESRDLLVTTLGSNVRVTIEATREKPVVLADRTQLELAVLNLAINARDAMPNGGALNIRVGESVIGAGAAAEDGAPPPGRYGAIAIRDSGSGMTPEVRRRVFEPFFTTKAPGKGSGLGLSQALGMARQLGGGITVDSRPDEGATMTLLLPLAEGPARLRLAPDREQPAIPDLGGLHVLLVDDDDSVRAATMEMLGVLGCVVKDAPDGPTALATLPSDIDIVVADFAMPGLNGAELAQRLSAMRPGLPVLLITGFADPASVDRIWRGPVLGKPFDLTALAAAVSSAVTAKATVD